MRVALLSYRSKPHCGGQGVYVRHLSRELAALGHHVEVFSGQPYPELDVVRAPAGDGSAPGSLTLRPLPSLDLYRDDDPFRTPAWQELRDVTDALEVATMWTGGFPEPLTFSLRAARELLARRDEFDIVHDNQSLGYGLLRLTRGGVPLVATVHHPITIDRRHEVEAAASLLRRMSLRRWYAFTRMQARVARRMSTLLTVSESSADDIVTEFGVRRSAVQVIPVGVETDVFRPPTLPRVPGRIVAVSSSDSPMKGVRVLLDAVAKLRTGRDVELVVVGRPKADGPVARAVDELGLSDAVRFVTGLSDPALAELFGSAEAAVVPSLYEGFSIPAVEAMACGTPLVASRGGALPEVVGDCGVLVEPGNPSDLADALGALLDDEPRRRALGAAGRRRVEDRFTWRATAAATAEVYADVVARRASC
ncbi:MAG TPA: glycosyltransferase family 4 protein [Mycobacteriales bacterium]|nr:glycosyltransferase family 4 protein [Mycobacteriales bacterium]